ncbi:MAG: phosphoribosylformylglycinamidine cyclo-ligase, partial [Actinomycetia bacterium]|nr:phosphoribosylformylglycinamidine cyclo-ligase [Actinomycetes bacterium]
GETAEMPGFYKINQYDLAGFAVGVVERKEIITGKKIKKSDLILGLPSNGLHSNGFSLVRKLIKKYKLKYDSKINPLRVKLGKELLKPTSIYVKQIKKLKEKVGIKGMAHITGGGISENAGRILPDNTDALIDTHSWKRPPIFNLLQNLGKITNREMFNTFNMGIGFVIVIGKDDLKKALNVFKKNEILLIGEIIKGEGEVLYE